MKAGRLQGLSIFLVGAGFGVALMLGLLPATSPSGGGAFPRLELAEAATLADDAAEQNKPADSSGAAEGIKVLGHWTIEVREPDGALASHHEFENALQNDGKGALMGALLGKTTFGSWDVKLSGVPSPCTNAAGADAACTLVEYSAPGGPNEFPGLTGMSTGSTVRLQGSATAQKAGLIQSVRTNVWGCSGSVAPIDCVSTAPSGLDFTTATLPSAISLSANQSFDVIVDISFK